MDPKLKTPRFNQGNHPINGLTYHYDQQQDIHWLIAAARNDDQLWLIDSQGQQETKIIAVDYFAAPSSAAQTCQPEGTMYTSGIEGVAAHGEVLWLINDPWKEMYTRNIQCPEDELTYQAFVPLLFSLPMPKIFSYKGP